MLSYYPPMSGEDDGPAPRPSAVMLCDVDKRGNLVNCRPYAGPAAMHGDDLPSPNTMICDVNRHGNLVNCRPYYTSTTASPHGWEFDGSSGFGGHGGHHRTPHGALGWEFDGSSGFGAAGKGGGGGGHASGGAGGAARGAGGPPIAAPVQPAAARQKVFTPPNTTRQFSETQRRSYGRMHSPRGYGYAGLGLAPRPWNWDPYYPTDMYYPTDVDPNYDPDAFVDDGDDSSFFGMDPLAEAKHLATAHKPLLAGATLAALGGYALGTGGALAGGLAGYYGAKSYFR